MSALAALLLSAQAAPADADRAMLDAFRAACARVENVEHMRADAVAAGWAEIAESEAPRVAQVNEVTRQLAGSAWQAPHVFRRGFGDRSAYLIVSRFEDRARNLWGNSCRVYHFEAEAPIAAALLEDWMGRAPSSSREMSDGTKTIWQPGWSEGMSIEIAHVRQDSAARQQFGLSGNVLLAQAHGEL